MRRLLSMAASAALLLACSGADDDVNEGPVEVHIETGGAAGTTAGGPAGKAGSAGAAGKAASGSAGAAGKASAGAAGTAGAGTAGKATAGAAGTAGASGGPAGKAGAAGTGSAGKAGGPALADWHLSGRAESTPTGPKFAWSGVSITTTFDGTGLSVTLEDGGSTNDFEVIVDGQRLAANKIEVTAGTHVYPVVSGLPPGKHTATIHRRTEGSYGATTFGGFQVTGGAIVPSPSPFAHRIEFIGDSITAGYGTECTSANEAFSPKTENHWLTYGAIAARNLSLDGHFIAWSGKGLVKNYGTDTSAKMPEIWERTHAPTASPAWSFPSWTADVVVINLGTNDWNSSPPVDPGAFGAAYKALVDLIGQRYPKVIVFGIGNKLVGTSHTTTVKGVMDAYGSPSRRYLELGLKSGEGIACQHPTAETHARWGMELTAAIQAATGW